LTYHNNSLNSIILPFIHLPNNVILSPVDYARNLGVIFDKNLSFAQHISSTPKSCFANFANIRDLRRIRNTIDQTTACTITTSLIHSKLISVTLFYSIYLLHKRIIFNLSLTQLLVLSPKLLNFITSLLFLNFSTDTR